MIKSSHNLLKLTVVTPFITTLSTVCKWSFLILILSLNACSEKSNGNNDHDDNGGGNGGDNEHKKPTLALSVSSSSINHYETIQLTADAHAEGGSIASVTFMLDGYKVDTLSEPPYIINLMPPVGKQIYSAIAVNDKGLASSEELEVVMVNPIIWSADNNVKHSVRSLNVNIQHPYLFVDNTLVEHIMSSGKSSDRARLSELVTSGYLDNNTSDSCYTGGKDIQAYMDCKVLTYTSMSKFIDASMYYGMEATFNTTDQSVSYAHAYTLALLNLVKNHGIYYPAVLLNEDEMNNSPTAKPVWQGSSPSDDPPRGRLFALGAMYDWIYDHLTTEEQQQIRNSILDHINYLDINRYSSWNFISEPLFSGGHSRKANISALAALLSIYSDVNKHTSEFQKEYYDFLALVINNFEGGFNAFLTWTARNGGSEKAWSYSTSYDSLDLNLLWEYATNENSWLTEVNVSQFNLYLYGLRNLNNWSDYNSGGYYNFPYSGDSWGTDYSRQFQGMAMLLASTLFDNGYAQWLYESIAGSNYYWHILYAKAPPHSPVEPADLPLSHHFYNSGQVVIRDSWVLDNNTLIIFKSTSFTSINHQHLDQNSFTIYYKGPLAIDSGGYNVMGAYASDHWWNYYTRSVAHNTLLIYDKTEDYGEVYIAGKKKNRSNDGGQQYRQWDTYPTLEEVKPGGESNLDGIIYFEEHNDYTYTMGDATKAYSSHKIDLYQRHLVSLRNYSDNHPVVVIYDVVKSKLEDFKKTYLLHSVNEPQAVNVSNMPKTSFDTVQVTIDSGIDPSDISSLYQQTLLPQNSTINIVGGSGYEFWVNDDGRCAGNSNCTPSGYNYIDGLVSSESTQTKLALKEAGKWRVEVSPSLASLEDRFLHVLTVADGNNSSGKVNATYLSDDNLDAVLIKDNTQKEILLLFTKNNENLDQSVDLLYSENTPDVLFIGLLPYTRYEVTNKNGYINIKDDVQGRFNSSSQGTLYLSQADLIVAKTKKITSQNDTVN